ncbi:MAG: hypothetical protein JJ863_27290 [Deltaproteobacteria bacterium]|nr:hypothetical protein [Deltaproteobacteria bacterium]
MNRSRWMVVMLASLAAASCREGDLTQIMVVVGTDIPSLTGVRIEVEELAMASRDVSFTDGRPATLGLVHRGGSLGPIVVRAHGLDGGTVVGPERSARVSFVEGEVWVLRLDLLDICRGSSCTGEQTCTGGSSCSSIDDATLEPWTGQVSDVDGSVPTDADVPPEMDGGTDAGDCLETTETCNGLDDDCDGTVDEETDLIMDTRNCGACGVTCASTCESRACADSFVAVGAGGAHSCATNGSGAPLCWGANDQGQLGNGSTAPSSTPVPVAGISAPVLQLALGEAFSCARTTDDEVFCWGDDSSGQLGDGPGGGAGPVNPGLTNVTHLSAGADHACAIASGQVFCWGSDASGKLGDGAPIAQQDLPVPVTLPNDAVDVAAGLDHSCAALTDGSVHCWGSGSDRQLGVALAGSPSPVRAELTSGVSAVAVAAGSLFTCAVTSDREAHCWGRPERTGDGTVGSAVPRPVDSSALGGAEVATLAAGAEHGCLVVSDGRVGCWGDNSEGQLGRGAGPRSLSAVPVSGLETAVRVAAGGAHGCARRLDGTVVCWGRNGDGQVGDGTTDERSMPVAVSGL